MKFWDVVTARKLERTWLRSFIVGLELFGIVSVIVNALRNPKFCQILTVVAFMGLVTLVFWMVGWLIVDWRQDKER